MQYRIEVQDPHDDSRWGPALMAIAGTSLTPERASTFETAEVAFEKIHELARLQPLARHRIVDAASGIVIWGPGERIDVHLAVARRTFLNGEPADPVEPGRQTRKPPPPPQHPIVVTHDPLGVFSPPKHPENIALLSAAAKRRRELAAGMPSVEVGEAMGAVIGTGETPSEAADAFVTDACCKFLNVLAPEVLESIKQIVAAQEEIVGGCVTLHELAARKETTLHMRTRLENETEQALYAAQEILTNLRALAKKLGAG